VTTVRAQCPDCGDVSLEIADLTVRTTADGLHRSEYRFDCPGCRQVVRRAASERIVELLVSAGAPWETWTWPAELREHPGGPPLTADDLLDLHVLLEQDGWFDELVALVRRTTPE
jgi:hypothetical protein